MAGRRGGYPGRPATVTCVTVTGRGDSSRSQRVPRGRVRSSSCCRVLSPRGTARRAGPQCCPRWALGVGARAGLSSGGRRARRRDTAAAHPAPGGPWAAAGAPSSRRTGLRCSGYTASTAAPWRTAARTNRHALVNGAGTTVSGESFCVRPRFVGRS